MDTVITETISQSDKIFNLCCGIAALIVYFGGGWLIEQIRHKFNKY